MAIKLSLHHINWYIKMQYIYSYKEVLSMLNFSENKTNIYLSWYKFIFNLNLDKSEDHGYSIKRFISLLLQKESYTYCNFHFLSQHATQNIYQWPLTISQFVIYMLSLIYNWKDNTSFLHVGSKQESSSNVQNEITCCTRKLVLSNLFVTWHCSWVPRKFDLWILVFVQLQ